MADLVKKPPRKPTNSLRNIPKPTESENVLKIKKALIKFINRLQERRIPFKAALELLDWIGDPNKHMFNNRKLWHCQSLDGARRNTITEKIEQNASLQYQDININEYFIMINDGIIMWCRIDEVTVDLILRQTSKIPSSVFKAILYVLDIVNIS